ncbi:hypothetical protein ACCUM_4012 [Candidatus Accumulibacter phosphatis]|uniref:Uncharacterized protein n=1 Tax=Candidatus Accumulibacter phosphatis TaxID=327160 RepID=A0A5S4EN57_9PROT|nr:hypothetical protein ACCUM_4012 [Candidatus Accumulibacter phosphatis]
MQQHALRLCVASSAVAQEISKFMKNQLIKCGHGYCLVPIIETHQWEP